jgi:hypothetical protein
MLSNQHVKAYRTIRSNKPHITKRGDDKETETEISGKRNSTKKETENTVMNTKLAKNEGIFD